ncbi:MAG: RcpC/CpaB family pilus assembly protein [Acidimicrobiales bacterium]
MAVRRKSTTLILVGVLVFLLAGVAVLLVLTRNTTNTTPKVATTPVASQPVASTGNGTATVDIGAKSLNIPSGDVALALSLSSTQAVGGYPVVGDKLDIFGTFKSQPSHTNQTVPLAKLVVSNVKVLAINEPAPSTTISSTVVVVAVTPSVAEGLIYLTTYEGIYTTLVTPSFEAPAATPGRSATNILSGVS